MTKQVQRRRGTDSQHTSFTGADGELSVNTTNKSVHVHDGVTAGGVEAARADLDNVLPADIASGLSGGTVASLTITSADINGGNIDGTSIGGSTPAAGTFSSISTAGSITVAGTVDGRDVAADGTKLDGIEAGATADQTAAEIKAAYEINADTNVFDDAAVSKLAGIEAGATADQTGSEIATAISGETVGSLTITSADINGGTIDNVTIGGTTAGAGTFTTGTFTSGASSAAVHSYTQLEIESASHSALQFSGSTGAEQWIWFADDSSNPPVGGITYYHGGTYMGFRVEGSERLRIDNSGNVGIGTSSPSYAIDTLSSGAIVAQFKRDASGGGSGGIRFGNNDKQFTLYGDNSNGLTIYDGSTERMRIDTSGNLLVNGTVYGGAGLSLAEPDNSGVFSIFSGTGTGFQMRFGNVTNGVVGSITTTTSATSYNTSSDYRLKEDMQPMTGAIERVNALNPVNFAWKSDGSRVDGFLAHEAQAVVPEAVHGTKDAMRDEEYEVTPAVLDEDGNVVTEAVIGTRSVPDYQGIDQSKLVPLLTAALQEAITKIETLETKVAALESA